jgi:hypothetical protein
MSARESASARRKLSNLAANALSAVNEEEKSENIPVEPVAVALAFVANEEVGKANQKLKMMQEEQARERIENEKEILRLEMEDAMIRIEEKKGRNKRRMYIFIFAMVVVVIIAGAGAYFGTRGSSTDNVEGGATPIPDQGDSPTVPDVPAPTPAPTTAAPSEIPTSVPLFDPPSEEDCAAIANGDALTNQEGGIVNEFNLMTDLRHRYERCSGGRAGGRNSTKPYAVIGGLCCRGY